MSFIMEILRYARARKKYWLLPIIVFMVILGSLLLFAKGSVLAPFIYTLF